MSRLDPLSGLGPRDGGYPRPFQRHSETSRAAAQSISEKRLGELHRRVWSHLKRTGGATDEAGMKALDMQPNTYRPRRRELELQGWVIDSGRREATVSGRSAIVWQAVTA